LNSEELMNAKIADFVETVHAMIGFVNFYLFDGDKRCDREEIKVFQGARLKKFHVNAEGEEQIESYPITPDLCIYLPTKEGVIGEVKRNLPIDKELWMNTFEQLMKYDNDLLGWPSEDGKVSSHDVVLLIHHFRSRALAKFHDAHTDSIVFKKPFAIVGFGLSEDGGKHYYFFRKELGSLSFPYVDKYLDDGVPVPMDVLITKYSTIKLTDDPPPLPYLMDIIWQHLVLPIASENKKFMSLRKKQKIDVLLTIDNIVEVLRKGFSFAVLQSYNDDHQTKTPRRTWVVEACDQFVLGKEAEWVDTKTKNEIKIYFQKYVDTLQHFVKLVTGNIDVDDSQMLLFDI